MENNDKKVQNAPSSDNTSALFVSSRKKQLEEQEAQRIAAEKEAQRIAAEEEVKRLEREVEQRRLQAEEDAKRIEAETIERRRLAEEAAKAEAAKAAEDAKAARAAANAPSAVAAKAKNVASEAATKAKNTATEAASKAKNTAGEAASKAKETANEAATKAKSTASDIFADKQKKMIALGAVCAVVLVIILSTVLGGGGPSDKSLLYGTWLSTSGVEVFTFDEENVTFEYIGMDNNYVYEYLPYTFSGGKININNGQLTLAFTEGSEEDFAPNSMTIDGFEEYEILPEGYLDYASYMHNILLANMLQGEWDLGGEVLLTFSPYDMYSTYGTVDVYVYETGENALSDYALDENGNIIVTNVNSDSVFEFYFMSYNTLGATSYEHVASRVIYEAQG